jgi:hypothetical protein
MSTYQNITRHPLTGQYELATWHDDYFGPHSYGVEFPSDHKIWPPKVIEAHAIYDFWKDDVVAAVGQFMSVHGLPYDQETELGLLNEIQHQYQERWKRDPVSGEGATEKSKIVYHSVHDVVEP